MLQYQIMKVIVIAAGFSTRLYPLTLNFPKGLLEIGGKAITAYVVDEIIKLKQVDEIVMVTNNRYYPYFAKWLKKNYPAKYIRLLNNGANDKDTRLGAIGDLQFVLDKTGWQEDLLVVSSDTLTSLNFNAFLEFFASHKGFINSIFNCHDKNIIKNKLGCAVVDGIKLIKFIEKPADPPTTLTSIPFYIYPKNSLPLITQYLKEGNHADAPGSIISWLIGKIATYAFDIGKGFYFDVGTKEVLEKLQQNFHKSGGV